MTDFAAQVRKRVEIPAGEIDAILQGAKTYHLVRGEAFCNIGQTAHEFGFVQDGLLQVYQVTEQGAHLVLDFVLPGMFALALLSATKKQPSEVCIEALGPVSLRAWPYAARLEAQARHSGWMRLETSLIEEAFARKQDRYQMLLTMTAEQRHAATEAELAPFLNQIPQHLLASYLHVTPQYLSRIKQGRAKPEHK